MSELRHAGAYSTGNWRPVGTGDSRSIRCDRCDARYPMTPENQRSAIDENYAGIYLRRLAAEGAELLAAEREDV